MLLTFYIEKSTLLSTEQQLGAVTCSNLGVDHAELIIDTFTEPLTRRKMIPPSLNQDW